MALLASPASVGAAAVGVRQGLLLFVGGAAMLWMPIGLSVALLVVVGSWVAGAWWWAVQLSEPIPRSLARQVSLAVGVGWGMGVGLAYLGLGLQPGQLDLPYPVLGAVTVALGVMGGLAAGGLTLCGVDAGHAVTP